MFLFFLLLFATVYGTSDTLEKHIELAYQSYRRGDQSEEIEERNAEFNRALKLYLQLEAEPGNGKLFYNIANTYFQLEEYGWAILYYLKAERLLPREARIAHQIELAEAKQSLPIRFSSAWKKRLFFWHFMLSQSERIELFILFIGVSTLSASLLLRKRRFAIELITYLFSIAALVVLFSLLYFHYVAPIKGVVVKPFGLYHGPAESYALVSDQPFIPGTQLKVQAFVEEGRWVQVETEGGDRGYIPSEIFRVI